MAIDTEIMTMLNDLVKFLETLQQEVTLPSNLENDRTNLLRRSRSSLASMVQQSSSPEPYLDMNAGKGMGLHLVKSRDTASTINDNNHTEYIDSDNTHITNTSQDDYESFQEVPVKLSQQTVEEEKLKNLYRGFTAEQTKAMCECKCINKCIGKCHLNMSKCGTLYQKEERKIFGFQLFEQFRESWIGIVGHHLLIYNTKHDKQPTEVISLRGYSARPATDFIARDPERSKLAFEIFCPGEKTYQFISKWPKEMEQWIAVINRAGHVFDFLMTTNEPSKENNTACDVNSQPAEEQYQDVGVDDNRKSPNAKESLKLKRKDVENDVQLRSKDSGISNNKTSAPPLPARIPRRLPSLPHEREPALSYNTLYDGYDEDDIYHKIEEFKHPAVTYQNLNKPGDLAAAAAAVVKNGKRVEVETYDDVVETQKKKDKVKKKTSSSKRNSHVDTYDDIQGIENVNTTQQENGLDERKSIMYDDIEVVVDNSKKDTKESPRKKSFLNRMRYKKESSKKEKGKKHAIKEPVQNDVSPVIIQNDTSKELPTYDDVSDISSKNNNLPIETMPEYTCPPPPRPIYVKPPSIDPPKAKVEVEEFYDDIGSLRNDSEKSVTINSVINTSELLVSGVNNDQPRTKNSLGIINEPKPNGIENDVEHYQIPRPQDPIDSGGQLVIAPVEEGLYDDIAILTDFRARQRDSACSNSSSEKPISNVTKAWNRFASGRKTKPNELSSIDKNRPVSGDELDTSFDSNEDNESFKLKKFQKLIKLSNFH